MDSILTSVKKLLGIAEEQTSFDMDLIIHINSAFSILNQLGAGPSEGFAIADEDAEWSDFLLDGAKLEMVKTYVYMKVRLMFDPPTSSSAMKALEMLISEFESRILYVADPGIQNGGG